MQANDSVSIIPNILQDQTYKSRHFIFQRILKENQSGLITSKDAKKSDEQNANLYWVKFHYASILIEEKYLTKIEEIQS